MMELVTLEVEKYIDNYRLNLIIPKEIDGLIFLSFVMDRNI